MSTVSRKRKTHPPGRVSLTLLVWFNSQGTYDEGTTSFDEGSKTFQSFPLPTFPLSHYFLVNFNVHFVAWDVKTHPLDRGGLAPLVWFDWRIQSWFCLTVKEPTNGHILQRHFQYFHFCHALRLLFSGLLKCSPRGVERNGKHNRLGEVVSLCWRGSIERFNHDLVQLSSNQ